MVNPKKRKVSQESPRNAKIEQSTASETKDDAVAKVKVTLVSFIKTNGRHKPEHAAQAFASTLMMTIFRDYQKKGEEALPFLLSSPVEIMKALNNHPNNTEYIFEAPAKTAVLLRTLYANVFKDYALDQLAELRKENLELKKIVASKRVDMETTAGDFEKNGAKNFDSSWKCMSNTKQRDERQATD